MLGSEDNKQLKHLEERATRRVDRSHRRLAQRRSEEVAWNTPTGAFLFVLVLLALAVMICWALIVFS